MNNDIKIKKASELLSSFFNEINIENLNKEISVFSKWVEIAGEELAAHSRIKDIENGVLIVEVDHPGWHQLLQISEKKILKKVKILFPDLKVNSMAVKIK